MRHCRLARDGAPQAAAARVCSAAAPIPAVVARMPDLGREPARRQDRGDREPDEVGLLMVLDAPGLRLAEDLLHDLQDHALRRGLEEALAVEGVIQRGLHRVRIEGTHQGQR